MRWWQSIHGHLGVLALALTLHPWVGLRRARRPSRGVRISGWLASGLLLLGSAAGWYAYPAYRETTRRALYAAHLRFGLAFEIKEHLAWFALAFALAGAALLRPAPPAIEARLRPTVRALYLLAFGLGAVSAGLGIWLAGLRSLPGALP